MRTEMIMPQMGESIAEATILKWRKKVGDTVQKDETILEISTDKVDSEIPAPASGVLVELLAKEGDTIAVKSIIAIIDSEGKGVAPTPTIDAAKASASSPQGATSNSTTAKSDSVSAPRQKATVQKEKGAERTSPVPVTRKAIVEVATGAERASYTATSTGTQSSGALPPISAPSASASEPSDGRFFSPLVRSIADQHNISQGELNALEGSGSHGRLTKNDLLAYIEHRKNGGAVAASTNKAGAAGGKGGASETPAVRPQYDESGQHVVPFDRIRKIISEHMVRSKSTSPHVYTVAEVDVTNIVKWREAIQPSFTSREGFKLSFTPCFLEAATKALVQFPGINASVEGENLIMKRDVNLGCAVALGTTGLIVPVIKNADQLSFTGIARNLNEIAQKARAKKLNPEDIQGGTFTVSNLGIFGSIMGFPIINQPQLAILGIGAMKKRVMVVDDMIAIRDMVYLTLSYDHRVIDGSLGGSFLNFITKYLEGWSVDRPLH